MSRPADVGELHFEEVEQFPSFDEIEHGQLFSVRPSNNTTQFTHGLHRFPAKFIPQVPAWALDNFAGRDSTVLDPFMGSGTTLVEGLLRGGTHIGLDIDPLARFIARAKTSPADAERVRELGRIIERRWTKPAKVLRVPMPDVVNFSHWFSLPQWADLQSLYETIEALKCSDDELNFVFAVFSSTLRWVSNADDQTQKTYVSGTHVKTPPPVRDLFWRFFGRAVAGLEDLNRKRHNEALVSIPTNGDATAIDVPAGTINLAVTSPPYLDSVDYMYNMMLEYFWLGPRLGVPNRIAYNQHRRAPVGSKTPAHRVDLPEQLSGVIDLNDVPLPRRGRVASYFDLMSRHFVEVARSLDDGGRYVLVIGNSQSVAGVLPVHEALMRQAADAGLTLERGFGYRIRRHYMKFPRGGRGGIILIDWVLVLHKKRASGSGAGLPLPWVTLAPHAVAH